MRKKFIFFALALVLGLFFTSCTGRLSWENWAEYARQNYQVSLTYDADHRSTSPATFTIDCPGCSFRVTIDGQEVGVHSDFYQGSVSGEGVHVFKVDSWADITPQDTIPHLANDDRVQQLVAELATRDNRSLHFGGPEVSFEIQIDDTAPILETELITELDGVLVRLISNEPGMALLDGNAVIPSSEGDVYVSSLFYSWDHILSRWGQPKAEKLWQMPVIWKELPRQPGIGDRSRTIELLFTDEVGNLALAYVDLPWPSTRIEVRDAYGTLMAVLPSSAAPKPFLGYGLSKLEVFELGQLQEDKGRSTPLWVYFIPQGVLIGTPAMAGLVILIKWLVGLAIRLKKVADKALDLLEDNLELQKLQVKRQLALTMEVAQPRPVDLATQLRQLADQVPEAQANVFNKLAEMRPNDNLVLSQLIRSLKPEEIDLIRPYGESMWR